MIAYRKTQGRNTKKTPACFDSLSSGEMAIYHTVPEKLDYVANERFDSPSAEDDFFGLSARTIGISRWQYFKVENDSSKLSAKPKKALTRSDEAELFLRYNYARMQLSQFAEAMKNRKTLRSAQAIVKWQERVLATRSDIVNANLALVIAMAKRVKIQGLEFLDLVSEGNLALLRSIEKFDVSRGFKLSTYACRAISKSFNRLATKTLRYRSRFPIEFDPDLERSDYDERLHEFQRDDAIDSLRDILVRNRSSLTETERIVIMERFAIGRDLPKGQTLGQVGKLVGLTNERVRQIQKRAIDKIRLSMTNSR